MGREARRGQKGVERSTAEWGSVTQGMLRQMKESGARNFDRSRIRRIVLIALLLLAWQGWWLQLPAELSHARKTAIEGEETNERTHAHMHAHTQANMHTYKTYICIYICIFVYI